MSGALPVFHCSTFAKDRREFTVGRCQQNVSYAPTGDKNGTVFCSATFYDAYSRDIKYILKYFIILCDML